MKISTFIISMLLIGLVVTTVGVYYAKIATTNNQVFDEDELGTYNQFQRLNEQTQTINQTLNTIESDNGVTDIIGGLLKSGYGVLKTTYYSVNIFSNMTNEAMNDAHLGSQTSNFSNVLILIVVVIILFIIMGVIIGREV